jgi:hypothetical protein
MCRAARHRRYTDRGATGTCSSPGRGPGTHPTRRHLRQRCPLFPAGTHRRFRGPRADDPGTRERGRWGFDRGRCHPLLARGPGDDRAGTHLRAVHLLPLGSLQPLSGRGVHGDPAGGWRHGGVRRLARGFLLSSAGEHVLRRRRDDGTVGGGVVGGRTRPGTPGRERSRLWLARSAF